MDIENHQVDQKKIILEKGNIVEFDFPIKETLAFDGKIIVLLDILENIRYNKNVFAIDFDGKILWQIAKTENLDMIGYCPFISIEIENLKLVSFNWCGFKFTVDAKTGYVTERIFTK
ncbi:hypothetical protein G7092_11815 [Mucilaginibacter sp. HC2]|uniref:hypothetical protein n=1 Tax=Mucilaginibacter inviolabilis TaxID=2714892 RepID=UPI001409D5A7|nr:hypothetical protein [Mucilaginibacter inviolabilis]NHA04490.1 hypothetical protein [Mucilaginibacter inviolabilis]